jgi:serine/threonine protein kinase
MKDLYAERYRPIKNIESPKEKNNSYTFLAEDLQLFNQPCFMKILKKELRGSPEVLAALPFLFEKEARILHRLSSSKDFHPKPYAFFKEDGEYCLVEEYVVGKTLSEVIKSSGVFTEAQVYKFLTDFLPFLKYLHSQELIHRDIKPSNIIIRAQDGKPILIDYGSVKEVILASSEAKSTPTDLVVIGTEDYWAPEQRDGEAVYASDLYSLGWTGIYLLTGKTRRQFKKGVNREILWQQDVSNIRPEFAIFLNKAVQDSLSNRYDTSQEMLESLKRIQPSCNNQLLKQNHKEVNSLAWKTSRIRNSDITKVISGEKTIIDISSNFGASPPHRVGSKTMRVIIAVFSIFLLPLHTELLRAPIHSTMSLDEDKKEAPALPQVKEFSFPSDSSFPGYQARIVGDPTTDGMKIYIMQKDSSQVIQTLVDKAWSWSYLANGFHHDSPYETPFAVFDMDFDGYSDLRIYSGYTLSQTFYECWKYNPIQKIFTPSDELTEIYGSGREEVDEENKIVTKSGGSMLYEYTVTYQFQNGEFVIIESKSSNDPEGEEGC